MHILLDLDLVHHTKLHCTLHVPCKNDYIISYNANLKAFVVLDAKGNSMFYTRVENHTLFLLCLRKVLPTECPDLDNIGRT